MIFITLGPSCPLQIIREMYKNRRCVVSNYRPVSVLPIVSKFLEWAVSTQFESILS